MGLAQKSSAVRLLTPSKRHSGLRVLFSPA